MKQYPNQRHGESWQQLGDPAIHHARFWFTSVGGRCRVDAVRVDLSSPGVELVATPRINGWVNGSRETMTDLVPGFIKKQRKNGRNVVVAINTDTFNLADARRSVPCDLRGYAIADGQLVSGGLQEGNGLTPTLFWSPQGGAWMEMTTSETPVIDAAIAVSGFTFVVRNGVLTPNDNKVTTNRSAIGLSADRSLLYLVTFSKATAREVGEQLQALGASDGINADGGGSTQMGWSDDRGRFTLLGGSLGRHVGQHLGVATPAPAPVPEPEAPARLSWWERLLAWLSRL